MRGTDTGCRCTRWWILLAITLSLSNVVYAGPGVWTTGGPYGGTIQALATQADESGLLATAQAFATAQGPGLVQTALAVATQQGPGILSTAQTYITQLAPGNAPADIPVIEGNKEMFFQSNALVSYVIGQPIAEVVEFYKDQMPANGWTKLEREWLESPAAANLVFEKPDRRASVVLTVSSGGGDTIVLVTIENK